MSEYDTLLSQLDFDKKIRDIKNAASKEEALLQRNDLAQKISTLQQKAMQEGVRKKIMDAMGFARILNQEIPLSTLEQEEDEDDDDNSESVSKDKCFIVDDVEQGAVSGFLEKQKDGIVLQFSGSDLKTCISRSNFRPSIIRQALLKTCIFNEDGNITGYSPENYVNMRKLGLFTDAIIDLKEVLGYFLGNTSVNQFELSKAGDTQILTSSYGLATEGESMSKEAAQAASTVHARMDYGIYSPQPVGNMPIIKAWLDRRVVPPNIVELSEATSAVSAAHCQAGQEKTIWKINEIDGFDYTSKYDEIIQSEEWKELFTFPYDEDILEALSGPLEDLGAHFVKAAIEIQNEGLDDTRTDIEEDDEDYDELDKKALIKCAIGEFFKKDGIYDTQNDETGEQLLKNKLTYIFGESWVRLNVLLDDESGILNDDDAPPLLTIKKVKEITQQSIVNSEAPQTVKNYNSEMIEDASNELVEQVINQIKLEIENYIDLSSDEEVQNSIESFNRTMEDLDSMNCSSADDHNAAANAVRQLNFDSSRDIANADTLTPEIEIDSDDESGYGNIGVYTPPVNDDDDQYENLIYCAFGKWYGENGNFEQLSKDEATGNGEQEPTSNDITNEKMEDFFSKEWIGVLLDRSADSVHGDVGIQEVLAGLVEPPFLNESKLISITESYIRDNTESESKKTELVTGLTEYSNMQEDPVEEILLSIQNELYVRINSTAREAARRAAVEAGDNISDDDDNVSYWDDHNDELLDICKTEIDGFTAELVRNQCNSSLFQVDDSFSQMAEAVANNQVNTRRGNRNQSIDLNDPLLTPISSINSDNDNDSDSLDQPMTLDEIADQQLERFVNASPVNFRTPEGGKRRRKRKKKTRKRNNKKNNKKKKKTKRVKFNLKNNEYYTITPKNRIKKNKRKQTRKKRK